MTADRGTGESGRKEFGIAQPAERMARPMMLILLVALLLRLIWGIWIPVVPISDGHAYDVFAQNIANGYGYGWEPNQPTAYWPPGTSGIYAGIFALFGHHYMPIVLFQIAIGVSSVALGMSLARKWYGDSAAIMTGWVLACWPELIQYTTLLASELLFNFFVLLAFWVASLRGRAWLGRAVATGVALAAASYVRPIALAIAPLAFLREAIDRKYRARAALASAVSVVIMSLCILPWTIRNWYVFQRFVPMSTNGGTVLWMGNNPNSTGFYVPEPKVDVSNQADRDRYLGKLAVEYIKQHPILFLVRMGEKAVHLYDHESIGTVWNEEGIIRRMGRSMLLPLKLISSAYWWVILMGALYGVYKFAKVFGMRRLLVSTPVAMWLYFTLVYSVTITGDRYGVSSIPFVAMIFAYALSASRVNKIPAPTRVDSAPNAKGG